MSAKRERESDGEGPAHKKQKAEDTPLCRVRSILGRLKLKAVIIPSEDAHMSEYIAAVDARRAFISGFTGSAGTAVVTLEDARLWTDGRYFLQAAQELSADWTLMKDRLPETPSVEAWLLQNIEEGGRVGMDPAHVSIERGQAIEKTLRNGGREVVWLDSNIVDEVWTNQPAPPSGPLIILPLKYTGMSSADKIALVRKDMLTTGADALVISALDEVAWLLNVRGSDVQYNPLTFAYVIVTPSTLSLFVDKKKVSPAVSAHLGQDCVVLPYGDVIKNVAALAADGKKVWLCNVTCNMAVHAACAKTAIVKRSPVCLAKALKNDVELDGIRAAHVRDAVAMVEWMEWLYGEVARGAEGLTEVSVSDKLEEFRSQQADYISPSFATISGVGPNGAIIHYHAQEGTCLAIDPTGMYLCDSGGQYLDGTTDITRTMHFGEPTEFEKLAYTRVLQGYIGLEVAVFPSGTYGRTLDAFARAPLWREGLDYQHGTGHGVGAFLNVHEGPHGISFRERAGDVPLQPGMTVTDEPGYYHEGSFGIRIENVLITKRANTQHKFAGKEYYTFEHTTLVPLDRKLMDMKLMTSGELDWVDSYHEECCKTLSPLLQDNDKVLKWLREATQPLDR